MRAERHQVRCKAYPHMSVQKLYENRCADQLLGQPAIHYNTLLGIVKKKNLLVRTRRDIRKRYEAGHVNDLWVCDFMHGPRVLINKRPHKAILCAIIDDHSRMITGHAFAPNETVTSLTRVLKDAFLAFGLPKRVYVDNGSAFSSEFLVKCCALAGISLTHSKPYDSPSRGKIERLFRTVRDRFLSEITEMIKRRGGIILLTGDPGVGKTISLRVFADSLNENLYKVIYTPLSTLNRSDILRHINSLLVLPGRFSKCASYQQIQKELLEFKEHRGKTVVFIVDEAHLLQTGTLEEIRLLTNFKMDSYDPYILILAGQSEFKRIMEYAVMAPLNQRIKIHYHMGDGLLKISLF